MGLLYLTENGSTLGIDGGLFLIDDKHGTREGVPKETVDGIAVFGQSQITSMTIRFCLDRGIPISYFSQNGSYYGSLTSHKYANVTRLKQQIKLTEDPVFCLNLAKKIVAAKLNNQIVVAGRYLDNFGADDRHKILLPLKQRKKHIESSGDIAQLMGYEGSAAREYFDILSHIVDSSFEFTGRNKRPARDPFNAMINMGYSMVSKEICGELENRGLCAYAGFMHQDKPGHASLASDMIEEWRPVIVDSTVLSLIQGHEINISHFCYEDGACRFTREGIKIFITKLEKKMFTQMKYLTNVKKEVTFRQALWHQAEAMSRMVDEANTDLYNPVLIR